MTHGKSHLYCFLPKSPSIHLFDLTGGMKQEKSYIMAFKMGIFFSVMKAAWSSPISNMLWNFITTKDLLPSLIHIKAANSAKFSHDCLFKVGKST